MIQLEWMRTRRQRFKLKFGLRVQAKANHGGKSVVGDYFQLGNMRKHEMKFPPDDATLVKVFRGLVIVEIVLTVLAIPLLLLDGLVSGVMLKQMEVQAGLEMVVEQAEPNVVEALIGVLGLGGMVLILGGLIVCWIGLLKFWNWSRWLYIATIIAGYLLGMVISLFDFSYQWRFFETMLTVQYYIGGMVIALAFLSPVATRFQGPSASSNAAPEIERSGG